MLHALLMTALATTPVTLRPLPVDSPRTPAPMTQSVGASACDDGTDGGTLVQGLGAYYGNRFVLDCASGRLTAVDFTYFGAGLAGPYSYRLHVLDNACREIGVTSVLSAASAVDAPASAQVVLPEGGWCVGQAFAIVLEPLTCSDGAGGKDCFPALVVDATSDTNPTVHCAVVSAETSIGRECLAPRSADGRFFDFRLRATVLCDAPGCITPVAPVGWSHVKNLYR